MINQILLFIFGSIIVCIFFYIFISRSSKVSSLRELRRQSKQFDYEWKCFDRGIEIHKKDLDEAIKNNDDEKLSKLVKLSVEDIKKLGRKDFVNE